MGTMADLIKERRQSLAISQEEAVARSGGLLSSASWRALESGRTDRNWTHRTLLGVCRALGWSDGGVDDLRNGVRPTLADQPVVDNGTVKRGELELSLTRGGEPVDARTLELLIGIADAMLADRPSE